MQRILAVLTGCIISVAVIFLTEALSHILFPPPAGIDPNNPETLKIIMMNAPPLALILVLLGAFLGSFAGGIIASIIGKDKGKSASIMVGIVLTILGALNLIMIPHPVWFIIGSLVVYIGGAYSGNYLLSKFRKNDQKN